MAIFSLRHAWLGKSHKDYKPGMGKAHMNYITRESRCTKFFGKHVPVDRHALKGWIDREETADRKNARIIDKIVIALPRELTPSQREALLREFCETASHGRASWVVAIHDRGKDAHNPHAHVVFRDRDYQTGRRVMMTTERGSTERFRELWETTANRAFERAGLDIRIDRRTLAAQGIDRSAEAHRGPGQNKARRLAEKQSFEQQPEEEKRRKQAPRPSQNDFDWTSRGSMVAQQWSASKWAKKANERARDQNPFDAPRKRKPSEPTPSRPAGRGIDR